MNMSRAKKMMIMVVLYAGSSMYGAAGRSMATYAICATPQNIYNAVSGLYVAASLVAKLRKGASSSSSKIQSPKLSAQEEALHRPSTYILANIQALKSTDGGSIPMPVVKEFKFNETVSAERAIDILDALVASDIPVERAIAILQRIGQAKTKCPAVEDRVLKYLGHLTTDLPPKPTHARSGSESEAKSESKTHDNVSNIAAQVSALASQLAADTNAIRTSSLVGH